MNYFELDSIFNYLFRLSGLGLLACVFILTILVLCIYILIYLNILNRLTSKFERWKYISDTLIRNSIFFEEDESASSGNLMLKVLGVNTFPIPDRVKKLLQKPRYRRLIMKEIIFARQNMTGEAAQNLKNLFIQLGLEKDALKMIKSSSWYLKASGIQYLGIMEMKEYRGLISEYTNNKRGLIRVEAQNAIIKFSGFEGLRFLDKISFPITEWQQIKILEELSQLPGENFKGIDKWLNSSNDTVIVFALKLARNYFRFELYEQVIRCLEHENAFIRLQAILTAKEIQTASTPSDLIKFYYSETERNKVAIVKVLEDVGTDSEFSFLIEILEKESIQLKIAAARALAAIGDTGLVRLESYPLVSRYPYNEIVRQVKAEMK